MGKRLSIWYVVFPAVTMLLVWPHVRELPPLLITKNFTLFQMLIALPFWVGLVAAPGYLYAWSGQYIPTAARSSVRLWVGASVVAALVASLGGFISVLMAMPVPFAVGSIVCSALMVRRFGVSVRMRRTSTQSTLGAAMPSLNADPQGQPLNASVAAPATEQLR